MCGAKCGFRKLALPLFFVFVVMSNNVVQADAPVSPPPAGTAVQIQTYGVLPVMLMNLTQSAINMNVSTNQASAYAKANTPIAMGLSGVAYAQGGTTPFFSNPTTPAITPSGATNASLQPVVLSSGAAANTNFGFVNAFALFPSWSGTVSFPNTSYTTYQSPGGASMGATPGPANTYHSVTPQQQAFGQSMANPSISSINLKLVSSTGATLPGYAININSLGGATSAYQSGQSTFPPKQDWVEDILTLLIDIDTILEPNPLTVADMVYGIYTSVKEMLDSGSEVYTNAPYPATYKGINVTAALPANGSTGLALPMQSGNSSYLVYNTTAANSTTTLPLEQQNSLIVYTWRTSPLNTSSPERNAADTLVVILVNNGVYAAAQMQTCLNSPSNAMVSTAKRQYKPRREESQDTFKLLEIITTISKKNPQDAQKMLDLFGMNGQYGKAKHDPNGVASIRMKAKEIFEKHKAEIPAIHSYLAKLAH